MKYLVVLLIPILFSACQNTSPIPIRQCPDVALKTGDIDVQDEYAIVEAILTEYYSDNDFVHIVQESDDGGQADIIFAYLDQYQISFDSATVESYAQKNDSVFYWKDQFNSAVRLFPLEEHQCLFKGNQYGWQSYYAKYSLSNGFLEFARPAINGNNEAILEYSRNCGNLCGYGYIVILKKEGGTWVVKHRIGAWIS